MKYPTQQVTEARDYLLSRLNPGDTVYTKLEHVSRSGMSRVISVYVIRDNEPQNISAYVGYVLGEPIDRDRLGVKVGGCGMDMGFHVVYQLSYALFGKGYACLGDGCPSSWHQGENYGKACAEPHTDGYALNHRWL